MVVEFLQIHLEVGPSELQDNGVCYSCAATGFALWPLLIALAPR